MYVISTILCQKNAHFMTDLFASYNVEWRIEQENSCLFGRWIQRIDIELAGQSCVNVSMRRKDLDSSLRSACKIPA